MGSTIQDWFNANATVLYISTFTKFRLFQNRIVKILEIKAIDGQVMNPIHGWYIQNPVFWDIKSYNPFKVNGLSEENFAAIIKVEYPRIYNYL
jgi:hypothetical protein